MLTSWHTRPTLPSSHTLIPARTLAPATHPWHLNPSPQVPMGWRPTLRQWRVEIQHLAGRRARSCIFEYCAINWLVVKCIKRISGSLVVTLLSYLQTFHPLAYFPNQSCPSSLSPASKPRASVFDWRSNSSLESSSNNPTTIWHIIDTKIIPPCSDTTTTTLVLIHTLALAGWLDGRHDVDVSAHSQREISRKKTSVRYWQGFRTRPVRWRPLHDLNILEIA